MDQDTAVAEAWGQTQWADYSGVSRTLQLLSMDEAKEIAQPEGLAAVVRPGPDRLYLRRVRTSNQLVFTRNSWKWECVE